MINIEDTVKHMKTLKIGNLVENKDSWKKRKAKMHKKNEKHLARANVKTGLRYD